MAAATVLTSEPRLLRDRLQKAHIDPHAVPTVLPSLLSKVDRKRFDKLIKARDSFRAGCSMEDAAKIACVSMRRFERLLTRYLTRADDKRISGERAFKRGWRVKEHPVRVAPLDPSKTGTFGAFTGVFIRLLNENVKLRADVVNSLRRAGKQALQTNHLVGRELRKMLVELYKKHGIGEDQYPMNTADKGLKALRRWIVTHFLPDFANDWIEAEGGPNASKAITTPQEPPTVNTDYEVYADFMLDECRVDLRTSMEIINKDGDIDLVEVECIPSCV